MRPNLTRKKQRKQGTCVDGRYFVPSFEWGIFLRFVRLEFHTVGTDLCSWALDLHSVPFVLLSSLYRQFMKAVIVGPPRSGKSTLCASLSARDGNDSSCSTSCRQDESDAPPSTDVSFHKMHPDNLDLRLLLCSDGDIQLVDTAGDPRLGPMIPTWVRSCNIVIVVATPKQCENGEAAVIAHSVRQAMRPNQLTTVALFVNNADSPCAVPQSDVFQWRCDVDFRCAGQCKRKFNEMLSNYIVPKLREAGISSERELDGRGVPSPERHVERKKMMMFSSGRRNFCALC